MPDHDAIVAGAGPAGLATAAELRRRGLSVTVLERTGSVGASWRGRYDGLRLNSMRQFSGLPGLRIPRTTGRYPTRDAYVSYLEQYTAHHRLDVRFGVALDRVEPAGDCWTLQTTAGQLAARHVVVATGFDAVPTMPDIPGIEDYEGEIVHAADFKNAAEHAGRDVLIIGAGNTGIDIAGLLDRAGARVSLAMRTPPSLFPRDLFGTPLQLSSIPLDRLPVRLGDMLGRATQWLAFGNLTSHGIPRSPEGYRTKFRHQLVGPAVDDGFVAGLKAKRIRVVQTVERFEAAELTFAGGERRSPDVVICATGYRRGLEPIVGHLDILRPDGIPINHHGAPEHPYAPRLYLAGFHGAASGQLHVLPMHARRIAKAATRRR